MRAEDNLYKEQLGEGKAGMMTIFEQHGIHGRNNDLGKKLKFMFYLFQDGR